MLIKYGYLVLGCGCTDCFPQAIFFNYDAAHDYGKEHCCNPEGYQVKMICVSELGLRDD